MREIEREREREREREMYADIENFKGENVGRPKIKLYIISGYYWLYIFK